MNRGGKPLQVGMRVRETERRTRIGYGKIIPFDCRKPVLNLIAIQDLVVIRWNAQPGKSWYSLPSFVRYDHSDSVDLLTSPAIILGIWPRERSESVVFTILLVAPK